MKLCPQCEFIYEDDQSVCDMDGEELVYHAGPPAFAETAPTQPLQEFAAIPANVTAPLAAPQSTKWPPRNSAVAALAAIILVTLLFVVYYARTHQPRSGNTNQASSQTSVQSFDQATEVETAPQEPAADLASAETQPDQAAGAESESSETTSSLLTSAAGSNRGRMAYPVSAGGSVGTAPGVIIWLANGASIKADEAWQKREGIWYRQGGVVTFLKRSQVRSSQQLDGASARGKSIATNPTPSNRRLANVTAQNQPSPAKIEPVSTKSKVTSFLKKTGRMLKKPFRL